MSNYEFGGVGYAESQDRVDEYRTGVPSLGSGQSLLDAPVPTARQFLSKVHAHNAGEQAALLRLMHQGLTKAVTGEYLVAHAQAANLFTGKLQFGSIVPGTVSITNAGAPLTVVDDGAGLLVDTGTTTQRGTINYTTGVYSLQYGAAITEPVQAAYSHTACTDFASAAQTITHTPPGSTGNTAPEVFSLAFGRVVPGSVAFDSNGGALSFVDDGKGNIIETTTDAAVAGSIDYATGTITIDASSTDLTAVALTSTAYTFNPFAALLAAGGGQFLADLFNGQIPELTQGPWAAGLKDESRVCLWGESRANEQTNLITKWYHASEDPFRVVAQFSGFPPGGHDNDPRVSTLTN